MVRTLVAVVLICSLPLTVLASFCGEAAVPFSFEVLPNGQPVLGCARPNCFGWNAEGAPAGSQASFYRYNRRPDGFFRKSADTPKAVASADSKFFKPQTAVRLAQQTFESEHCSKDTQWVGGIGPLLNATELPLALQCCEYSALKLSEDRGDAVVGAEQIVIGGEVFEGSRQFAFDYISNIVKNTFEDGKVTYSVGIKRFPCLPYPAEFSINIDKAVKDEILRRFGEKHATHNGTAKAFQAPIVNSDIVDPQNLVIQTGENVQQVVEIQGPFVAENEAVVEETNALPPGERAIEGILLPEGNVPNVVNAVPETGGAAYGASGYGASGYGASGYYPVSGYGGGSGGFFCFSGDTKVIVQGDIEKRMDELEVDDWVMAGNDKAIVYSRVESWLHRMPEVVAEFVHFTMEDGTELKLTNKHYIFRGDCSQANAVVDIQRLNADMVFAEDVALNECLFIRKSGIEFYETRIASIEKVQAKGIYAPMTHSGNIVANNVYASCFNIINDKQMQKTLSSYLRSFASSFWTKLWVGQETTNDIGEIELVPGMRLLVNLLQHILPSK